MFVLPFFVAFSKRKTEGGWILQRADPYVYSHIDGTCYFTASVPAYDRIVLRHADALGIYGPGHNSFTTDEEGNDILVFHARTEEKIKGDPLFNPNRHAMLMKVRWDAGGKPVFSFDNI